MANSSAWKNVFEVLAFFGPFYLAVTVSIVAGLIFNHRRRCLERNQATQLMEALLANPKLSPDDIEQLMRAWWGQKMLRSVSISDPYPKEPDIGKQLPAQFASLPKELLPFDSQPPKHIVRGAIATGLGTGCLIFVLAAMGLLLFGHRMTDPLAMNAPDKFTWPFAESENFAEPFADKGYERTMRQYLNVHQTTSTPQLLIGEFVNVNADIHADMAVLGQYCEIDGTVSGDIDFMGQYLTIKSGAVVEGDIISHGARSITIKGKAKGKVAGSYLYLYRTPEENEKSKSPKEIPSSGLGPFEIIENKAPRNRD